MLDLLQSLQKRLNREEREWREQNRLRSELELGPFRSWMLRLANRAVLAGTCVFILAALISVATAVIPSAEWTLFEYEGFEVQDRTDQFSALLAAQATLVALIYPIVISFVALLIAQRSSAVALLHIYIHDSCALLAGLSSLLLVALMGLQFIGLNYVNDSAVALWLVIDALWFAANIGLSLYFLGRTFEFLRPERRAEIIRVYAISVAWPMEARAHLGRHLFSSAAFEGVLPGQTFDGYNKDPSISLGGALPDMGEVSVARHVGSKRRQLVDVRFLPLKIAVSFWLRRAKKHHQPLTQKHTGDDLSTAPVLFFPVDPFETYEGNTTLCKVQNGPRPGVIVRALIDFSFVFRPLSLSKKISISTILSDIQADAVASLRQGDHAAFEASSKQLLDIYLSLLVASRVADSSGSMANLSELRDSSFFARPVHEVWARKLIDLFSMAAKRLPESRDAVELLAYLPARLISKCGNDVTPVLLMSFLEMSPILLRRIEDWWSSVAAGESQQAHGPCNAKVIGAPLVGSHSAVIQAFVESWEHIKALLPPKGTSKLEWGQTCRSMSLLEAHLGHSATMLMDCVLRGDSKTADWLTDALLKWHGEIRYQFDHSRTFAIKRQHLLDASILDLRWDDARARVEYESFDGTTDPTPSAVLFVCVRNAWIDTCCIVLYLLIRLARSCRCETSFAARVASAIMKGEALLHGAEESANSPYRSVDDLLVALVRQTCGGDRYVNTLDSLVERVIRLETPSAVAGRMYFRVGSDDVASLAESQLVALLLATPARWQPSRTVSALLATLASSDRAKYFRLRRTIDRWIHALGNGLDEDLITALECLREKVGQAVPFEDARDALQLGLVSLNETVDQARTQAIAVAPISQERLEAISESFGRRAFDGVAGEFPIPFFDTRHVGDDTGLLTRSIAIRVKRGELTNPPMDDIAANEDEWLSELGSREIASSVLGSALFQVQPISRRGTTPRTYWTAVKRFASEARASGLDPLLIVENANDPAWLWDWANPTGHSTTSTPRDLVVGRNGTGKAPGFQFSLNDVNVYEGPIPSNQSVMVVRESFVRLDVFRFEDGRLVNASTKEIEGDLEHVDLVLTWKIRVVTQSNPAVSLTHEK